MANLLRCWRASLAARGAKPVSSFGLARPMLNASAAPGLSEMLEEFAISEGAD
jgi:hypothetical protein